MDTRSSWTRIRCVSQPVERAVQALPAFRLTEETAPIAVKLCHRLDGIPLAIELAAARVASLSLPQIEARLDDCFRLLTGGSRTALPRQQTLRATMDWSYRLLSEPERTLWRGLSVFARAWTLEAAEAVCGRWPVPRQQGSGEASLPVPGLAMDHRLPATADVLEGLTSLLNKSIVLFEEEKGEARYRMLETLRRYGRERLEEAGEAAAARDRHLAYCLALAERAEQKMEGRELVPWLNRLQTERDNLRAALEWGRTGGGMESGLRLASALSLFWLLRDHKIEVSQWLEDALVAGGEAVPKAVRAKALLSLGAFLEDSTIERKDALLEESLALFRELGDPRGVSYALYALAYCRRAQGRGDSPQARARHEEGLAAARQAGDRFLTALSLWLIGEEAREQGDYSRAAALLEEGVSLGRQLGNPWVRAWPTLALGQAALLQGDEERAGALLAESDALLRGMGARWLIARSRETYGMLALWRGDHAAAVAYFEENLAIKRELPNRSDVAWALLNLGWAMLHQGEYLEALRYDEAALTLSREIGNEVTRAYALQHLGEIARLRGDIAAAHAFLEESLLLWQKFRDHYHGLFMTLRSLARLAVDDRDYQAARDHCREQLVLAREMGQRRLTVSALEALARALVAEGMQRRDERRPEGRPCPKDGSALLAEAARLLGAAEALWHPMRPIRETYIHADHQRSVSGARVALGEEPFVGLSAEGRAMTLEQALSYGLEVAAG